MCNYAEYNDNDDNDNDVVVNDSADVDNDDADNDDVEGEMDHQYSMCGSPTDELAY